MGVQELLVSVDLHFHLSYNLYLPFALATTTTTKSTTTTSSEEEITEGLQNKLDMTRKRKIKIECSRTLSAREIDGHCDTSSS